MFLKILFLLAYFILVFVTVHLFEYSVNLFTGGTAFTYFYDRLPVFLHHSSWFHTLTKPEEKFHHASNYKESKSADNQNGLKSTYVAENDVAHMEFVTYDDFIEHVEDTKAGIWVVQVITNKSKRNLLNNKKWKWLSHQLKQYGIKTGIYKCKNNQRLCQSQNIKSSTMILTMPRSSRPKGNVILHTYSPQNDNKNEEEDIFRWVQTRLYPKVKTLHSLSELTEQPVSRYKHKVSTPSLSFIYQSDNRFPPLLLTSLSVKFTGRIKFYMLKTNEKYKHGHVFAMNKFSTYSYGKHKGENFTYSCMDLFLKTLHPELNDIFIVSVVLLNMACWLELFLHKGGPLKRLFYCVWGFTMANVALVSIWLPVIQLLYMPQVQPIIEVCLKSLQQIMFTNIAAIIRQDFLHITQHLYIVFIGFVCYGIFIGYLHYKLRNDERNFDSSFVSLFDNDIREMNDMIQSIFTYMTPSLQIYRFEEQIERVLHRLSTPDIWLHSFQTSDYILNLPKWKHCNKCTDFTECYGPSSDSEIYSDVESIDTSAEKNPQCLKCHSKETHLIPNHILTINECVICLDMFKCKNIITGLPCGHSFHKYCIEEWLLSGNSQHRCPVCRWPADMKTGKDVEFIDAIE